KISSNPRPRITIRTIPTPERWCRVESDLLGNRSQLEPMPTPANPTALAQQARRSYVERLLSGVPAVVQAIDQGAKLLAASVAEPAVALKRRELLPTLQAALPHWQHGMMSLLKTALASGTVTQTRLGELPAAAAGGRGGAELGRVHGRPVHH